MKLNKTIFSYDVVICTFNGAYYISQQLDSILNQSILPSNIIVSDDGSDDKTIELVKDVFHKYNFRNYKVFYNNRLGVVNNFFLAISKTTSDIIFLSDQDDVWRPDKIDHFMSAFSNRNERVPVLVFSDALLIDGSNNIIANSFFNYQGLSDVVFHDDSILYRNCVQGAACAFNKAMKELLMSSLNVIDAKQIYMHDWWLALLAKYYGDYVFINDSLISYRQHANNQVGVFNKYTKYIHYAMNFKRHINNFKKVIRQKHELDKFSSVLLSHKFVKNKLRLNYISYIKKIILKFYICR